MGDDVVLLDIADGVATVSLNRPQAMNAPNRAMARTIGGDALAVYFMGIEDAGRFLAAFPSLPLAMARG